MIMPTTYNNTYRGTFRSMMMDMMCMCSRPSRV